MRPWLGRGATSIIRPALAGREALGFKTGGWLTLRAAAVAFWIKATVKAVSTEAELAAWTADLALLEAAAVAVVFPAAARTAILPLAGRKPPF